jgi:NADH-quinone oxidoreductase subunit A
LVDNWGFVLVFLIVLAIFPMVAFGLAYLVRPRRPGPIKLETYECGLETVGDTWLQFRVQYYIFALIFLVFDVETVFLYPWAVAYNQLPLFALFEMGLFILLLVVALAYAWRKDALRWS